MCSAACVVSDQSIVCSCENRVLFFDVSFHAGACGLI